jgi:hypothetical protein
VSFAAPSAFLEQLSPLSKKDGIQQTLLFTLLRYNPETAFAKRRKSARDPALVIRNLERSKRLNGLND